MNHGSLQIGLTLYVMHIFMYGYLIAKAWKLQKTYFLLFCLSLMIRSLCLIGPFWAQGMETYSRLYWMTDPLVLFATIVFLCEFFWLRGLILDAAIVTALIQAVRPSYEMERIVGLAVGVLCIYLVAKRYDGLARGMVIAAIFPAIGERAEILLYGQALRFVPTVAFLIAQCVWIVSLRTARLEPSHSEAN